MKNNKKDTAKPFLKWAGGKTQLLQGISDRFPFKSTQKFIYVEPFVGSGAVLFWVLQKFPKVEQVVINDINADLITAYRVIASQVTELIEVLQQWQDEYHRMDHDPEAKSDYYYHKREQFNKRISTEVEQTALLIFLNRTCYNGLYRVNTGNRFNVPVGRYKKPTICDAKNLKAVHQALQNVEVLHSDFEKTLQKALTKGFFYFDPPYKPLNATSSFNSYSNFSFGDAEQERLKNFCDQLHALGHQWMLSNSDVKVGNPDNHFFDDLYKEYYIERVPAKRNINSNGQKRGILTELLITNYRK